MGNIYHIISNVRLVVLDNYESQELSDYLDFEFVKSDLTIVMQPVVYVFRKPNGIMVTLEKSNEKVCFFFKQSFDNESIYSHIESLFKNHNVLLIGDFVTDEYWLDLSKYVHLIDIELPSNKDNIDVYSAVIDKYDNIVNSLIESTEINDVTKTYKKYINKLPR